MAAFSAMPQPSAALPPQQSFFPRDSRSDQYAQTYLDDDDASILDDSILDHSALDSGLEMSPPMPGTRRESFAVSAALFSPKQEDWQPVDMHNLASNNPFGHAASHNPFLRSDPAAAVPFPQTPAPTWALAHAAALNTPMPAADLDASTASVFQRPVLGSQNPFSTPAFPTHPLFSSASNSSPASPQDRWAVVESMEHRAIPKRMRPHSPTLRSHGDLTRRDGIRKKNARFDIPAERNLSNIDQMIATSTDDGEIKELKQQKRLLRNRQAALDSRQRKKQHTERLEDEKKHYTSLINELEEELADTRLALDKYAQKEQQWEHLLMSLQHDKEEMLRAHTIESGDLRRKVSILTEQVQHLEMTAVAPPPQPPATTSFTAEYADMDTLAMDGAWDHVSFLHDYGNADVKVENALVPAKRSESASTEAEKPAAQGLLLMLLLVGAFVASKGASSVPRMSDDVRAASATLLQDVFHDAGVAHGPVIDAIAPLPSDGATWPATSTADLSSGSTLGDLADRLARPTLQQVHEHAFSLSAAQYEGLTSNERLGQPPPPSTSAGRRNLAESLAAMRAQSKKSAAEVYTRSLLWDQVPREVVRNFAQLVAQCDTPSEPATIRALSVGPE